MSKESEPVRSRRELREAQAAQKSSAEKGKPAAPLPHAPKSPAPDTGDIRHSRRATAAPVDAPPAASAKQPAVPARQAAPVQTAPAKKDDGGGGTAPRERSSQTRARDRAALRAYKELSEPAGNTVLPSRRALRQAQVDGDRAPATGLNKTVAPNRSNGAQKPAVPASKPSTGPAAATPAQPSGSAAAQANGRQGRRSGPGAPDAVTANGPKVDSPAAAKPGAPSATGSAMSVEAALAARNAESIPAPRQGKPPATSAMPIVTGPGRATASSRAAIPSTGPIPESSPFAPKGYPANSAFAAGQTPSEAELKALAEQRAQAERTAILTQRAQAKERLAQESANSRGQVNDPTAVHNLAMVTPLEFVKVPGLEKPVLRPPGTSHIPVITRSTPKQAAPKQGSRGTVASRKAAKGAPAPSPRPAAAPKKGPGVPSKPAVAPSSSAPENNFEAALTADQKRPNPHHTRQPTGSHGRTLQRAEAVARGGKAQRPNARPAALSAPRKQGPLTEMPPLPADNAHGLEPLDAVTAGLGRTHRNHLIQWGSVVIGAAALVAGLVMIITGLAH